MILISSRTVLWSTFPFQQTTTKETYQTNSNWDHSQIADVTYLMDYIQNVDLVPLNLIFSKLTRVSYFQSVLAEILRVRAFQWCAALLWRATFDYFTEFRNRVKEHVVQVSSVQYTSALVLLSFLWARRQCNAIWLSSESISALFVTTFWNNLRQLFVQKSWTTCSELGKNCIKTTTFPCLLFA